MFSPRRLMKDVRNSVTILLSIAFVFNLEAQILPEIQTFNVFSGKYLNDIQAEMAKHIEWTYNSSSSVIEYGTVNIKTETLEWEMSEYVENRYFTQNIKVISPQLGIRQNIVIWSSNSEYLYNNYLKQCSSPCLVNTSADIIYSYFGKSFMHEYLFENFQNIEEGGFSGNCTYAVTANSTYTIVIIPPKLISKVQELNSKGLFEKYSNSIAEIEYFIANNDNLKYAEIAQNRLEELWLAELRQSKSVSIIDDYLSNFPDAKNKEKVLAVRQKFILEQVLSLTDIQRIKAEIETNNFSIEQIVKIDNRIEELKLLAEQQKKLKEYIAEGDRLFSKRAYAQAEAVYKEVAVLDKSGVIKSKIELCERGICNLIISKGDSLFREKFYQEALELYTESRRCFLSESSFRDKLKITNKKILDKKIQSLISNAKAFFNENDYNSSLAIYKSILNLDAFNVDALKGIDEIKKIVEVLRLRSTKVFSYKKAAYKSYFSFQNSILSDLDAQIRDDKKGYVNVNFQISFDTLGNNLSDVKNILASSSMYIKYFDEISNSSFLKPYSQGNYFLASEENIVLDIDWSSTKEHYKTNSKGLYQSKEITGNKTVISDYLNRQPYKYGKCIIDVKNKKINGSTFTDIEIVKYKTNGPGAALYSAIMPGIGTLKVTYGNKGWGRLSTFLLSSGLAIGSKFYSDDQYAKYLVSQNPVEADEYYTRANEANKSAIIFGGVAATIYVYDICWVVSKGFKNLKESRSIRNVLRKGTVKIKSEPLKL